MKTVDEATALKKLFRPLSRSLTVELAYALVNLQADEETQTRYDTLAEKRTQGSLTPPEFDELEAIVRAVIVETGAQSVRDMSKVMPLAMERIAGQADGRAVNQIVRRLLG